MGDLRILLTNDDGIDAPGLRALYDAVSTLGDVTVVAPATNQSAVGRSLSYGRQAETQDDAETAIDFAAGEFSCAIPYADHDLGYAVHGTPCDCVIVGVHSFDPPPDVVVAGCNPGANLGAFVLGRSGTASAAMEAAFLGVPGVAVSMDRIGYPEDLTVDSFADASAFAADLIAHATDAGVFERVDYLNVNAPPPDVSIDGIELTRPSPVYEMDASLEDGAFHLHNQLWQQMADADLPDPPGTDRRALAAGRVSVSPLAVPMEPVIDDGLQAFAERFR